MKKLSPLLLFVSLGAWAADFWQTKSFTDWDQKEVQKILTDSPWAKKVSIYMPAGGGAGGNAGGGGGSRSGRGGGPAGGNNDPGIAGGGAPGIAETAGPGGRGGGGELSAGGGADAPAAASAPALPLLVSCRSALPVRQALAKVKYGAEAATSPDAKKLVEDPQQYYIISVAGLPAYLQPRDDEAKQALIKQSSLSVKGKDSLAPVDIQFAPDGRNLDVDFIFPRMVQFTAEDKEIEFAAKATGLAIKQKFNLKNMVINGKLEL
jgi:hypothetical protein